MGSLVCEVGDTRKVSKAPTVTSIAGLSVAKCYEDHCKLGPQNFGKQDKQRVGRVLAHMGAMATQDEANKIRAGD